MTHADEPPGGSDRQSPEAWRGVRVLVEEVLSLPVAARDAHLRAACGDDLVLHDRVLRLVASCEQADAGWAFLGQPAGELVAPLLASGESNSSMVAAIRLVAHAEFVAALADRYVLGDELGRGGMATVYRADDLRHTRKVAIKVFDPEFGASFGAERFLSEIRVTAGLQHPNLLPLFDSGEAVGVLYYVMPLIEGATLRTRLVAEHQLPLEEALSITASLASALDHVHRQGVVHRDIKPENILFQHGQPLLGDFGIAHVVERTGQTPLTAPGTSLGTPRYMSPEQVARNAIVDARSDIYSLACVLYEMLVGDPPFMGSSVQNVLARVLTDAPPSVRTVRPSVPPHVEAALNRAMAKVPSDRFATARAFAEAIAVVPGTPAQAATPTRSRRRALVVSAGLALVAVLGVVWMQSMSSPEPVSKFTLHNLIGQSLGNTVTITPDGRSLIYSGNAESGRRLMFHPLDGSPARMLAGTEGASSPAVAPDGQRLAFHSEGGSLKTIGLESGAQAPSAFTRVWRRLSGRTTRWRYGNSSWDGDSAIITENEPSGLMRRNPDGLKPVALTYIDSARGESVHQAALLLPGTRSVVFTVSGRRGPRLVSGQLAIASLDSSGALIRPHRMLGIRARRALAFVDGWLLYTSLDGTAIMAVQLDVNGGRAVGTEIPVLNDAEGNLETGALTDNGTLLYVQRPRTNSPVLVDSGGGVHQLLAGSELSYMHPRISLDGNRFAIQVTSAPNVDNIWEFDFKTRTPVRLTTSGRAQHPTWTLDGRIVFMTSGSRELMKLPAGGGIATDTLPDSGEAFAPMAVHKGQWLEWVVFQRGPATGARSSIWMTPLHTSGKARKVVNDSLNNLMPAVSPDGRWLAYASGPRDQLEVYVRPLSDSGSALQVSRNGGIEPAWSPDGRRLYYLNKGAMMAAEVTTTPLAVASPRQLFKGAFVATMAHRNYDVMPDGSGFLMIEQTRDPVAVVWLNWLPELRARLRNAR